MKTKKTAKEKREEKAFNFDWEMEKLVLHPDFENRVSIKHLFYKKTPVSLITGRRCTGEVKKKNKITGKFELTPTYSNNRLFVVFKDGSRMSICSIIFRWLKTEDKLHHEYENYYA